MLSLWRAPGRFCRSGCNPSILFRFIDPLLLRRARASAPYPPIKDSRPPSCFFFSVFILPFFFRLSRQLCSDTAVGKGSQPLVEHVREAPQQRNGFDCGMYTVLLAERLALKATAAATPTPLLEVGAGVGAGPASLSRKHKMPHQDKEAVLTAGESARAASGGGSGVDGGGGARVGVSSSVAAETGSDEAAAADAATIMITPDFVSNARNLAKDRLLGCIHSQG